MKILLSSLFIMVFLNACQTHLPLVSDEINDNAMDCQMKLEEMQLADIDYLLHANRMVDSMIADKVVQEQFKINRMKLSISPIQSSTDIDTTTVNLSIKNRILRSGHFIVIEAPQTLQAADFQLSGKFEQMAVMNSKCQENYEQFSLQLINNKNNKIVWSERKNFK